MTYIRNNKHAGEWYPTNTEKLNSMIDASFYYTNVNNPDLKKGLRGIISPHSCYQVCLRAAAHSYSVIDPDNYDRIFVFGTCHHQSLVNCLVSQASAVETPFGQIQVDTEMCQHLVDSNPDLFTYMSQEVDEKEHSLEMQYPLIKYVFQDRDIRIVPFLVGSLNEVREASIAEILRPLLLAERTLFILSSDFTHWGEIFHYFKFISKNKDLSKQTEIHDEKALNIITAFNYEHFRLHIEETHGSICGSYSICLIMHVLNKDHVFEKIFRSELCKIQDPKDFSISYVAGAFYDESTFTNVRGALQNQQCVEENNAVCNSSDTLNDNNSRRYFINEDANVQYYDEGIGVNDEAAPYYEYNACNDD